MVQSFYPKQDAVKTAEFQRAPSVPCECDPVTDSGATNELDNNVARVRLLDRDR
jgi:hypothetical protein